MVRFAKLNFTGMKRMASERKNSSSRSRSRSNKRVSLAGDPTKMARTNRSVSAPVGLKRHYAVCVRNDNYPASLELRKLYPVLEDSFAAEHGLVRVIDESGEDYLYPNEFFLQVDLPKSVEKALAKIA
jgi:hypothetical protein